MGCCCSASSLEAPSSLGPKTLFVSPKKGSYRMLSDAVHHAAPGDRIVVSAGSFQEQNVILIDKPIEIIAANCFRGDMSALGVNNNDTGDQNSSKYAADGDTDDEGDYGMTGVGNDSNEDRPRGGSNSLVVGESKIQIQGQKSRLITVEVSSSNSNGLEACVTIRGLNLLSTSDEQAVVAVTRGTLRLEKCQVSGGQDCVSVHGAYAFCNIFNSTLRDAAHATLSFAASARGMVRSCVMTSSPTGVVVSTSGDPTITDCTVRECGTGVLVRDEGNGIFSQCVIEKNSKPGIIVSGRSNPVLRRCRISDGESNGIFVRDEGRGVFVDCEVSRNGLPAVATCNESYPVLCHCMIHEGQNAGVLIYDNGSGIISKCIIRDNHMPGIEVRAGGHPIVAGCEIFNHESNGVYVHNRGRGVFHGCRIYENVLPGVAIRTAGHPIIHGCSIVTGKDSALMVCDKGKGVILESALKGYSARPLEIRDGCNPIIQFCELHDGKHRHVMEWLQQIPKVIKPVDIEALGWSDEQLAAEDKEAMETSPLCKQLGDGTGPIVLIGEEKPAQPTTSCPKDMCPACDDMVVADNCEKLKPRSTDGEAPNSPVPMMDDADNSNRKPEDDVKDEDEKQPQPKVESNRVDNVSDDGNKKGSDEGAPEKEEPPKQKKNRVKLSPKKGGKKKGKGKADEKSDSGSSEEQTSSITLSGSQSDSDEDGTDSAESTSEITADLMMSSSTDGALSPAKKEPSKRSGHHHKMRSTENGKKKLPAEGKKSKNKPKP